MKTPTTPLPEEETFNQIKVLLEENGLQWKHDFTELLVNDLLNFMRSFSRKDTLREIDKWWKEYFKRNKEQVDIGTFVAVDTGIRQKLTQLGLEKRG